MTPSEYATVSMHAGVSTPNELPGNFIILPPYDKWNGVTASACHYKMFFGYLPGQH